MLSLMLQLLFDDLLIAGGVDSSYVNLKQDEVQQTTNRHRQNLGLMEHTLSVTR